MEGDCVYLFLSYTIISRKDDNDMDGDAIMGHVSSGKCSHVSFVFLCGLSYASDLFGLGGEV